MAFAGVLGDEHVGVEAGDEPRDIEMHGEGGQGGREVGVDGFLAPDGLRRVGVGEFEDEVVAASGQMPFEITP